MPAEGASLILTSLHGVIEEPTLAEISEDGVHEVIEVALGKGTGGNLFGRLLLLHQSLPLLMDAALLQGRRREAGERNRSEQDTKFNFKFKLLQVWLGCYSKSLKIYNFLVILLVTVQ